MDDVRVQTAHNVEIAFEAASLSDRIFAWMIDIAVLIGYNLAVQFALAQAGVEGGWGLSTLVALPIIFYHLLAEVFFNGQTVGKAALKIRVARLDGGQPSVGDYTLRWLLRWLDVTASLGAVAIVSIASNRRSQRLGDLAAGTTVVRLAPDVKLADLTLSYVPDDYAPLFPQADRLGDREAQLLADILKRLRRMGLTPPAYRLAHRAKAVFMLRLGVDEVDLPPGKFLTAVLKDYNALREIEAAELAG